MRNRANRRLILTVIIFGTLVAALALVGICVTGCETGTGTDTQSGENTGGKESREPDNGPGSEPASEPVTGQTNETVDETAGDETPDGQTDGEADTDEPATADPTQKAERPHGSFLTGVSSETGDGYATITTDEGLTYRAEGYKGVRKGYVTFNAGLKLTFTDETRADGRDFNRFMMGYSATQPVHITVTFERADGTSYDTDYYCETGTQLFCAVVPDYMDGGKAGKIVSMTVDTCDGHDGQFTVYRIDTETVPVPETQTSLALYYVESERYRLGLSLKWGGTIAYLKDSECPIKQIKSLINNHDSGRLVQQSYYGTAKAQKDFTPGRVGNEDWMYNPVQAGDYGNNGSRIVDVVFGYQSFYIKVQPMDWGQVGWFAPAYMENVYTVTDDYVRVDNRYTDFGYYDNPWGGQEIPAFYTLSWFNEYVWYDGDTPWTGDALSYNTDIEMVWTQTEHLPNFGAYTKVDNTETWCAVFSREDNYGIGLYVPNVDYRSVGIYMPGDRTKNNSANSTTYMGASNRMRIVSGSALEYSYLITTGSVDEIRGTFTENRDFADNETLHVNYESMRVAGSSIDMSDIVFKSKKDLALITQTSRTINFSYDENEGAVLLTATGEDPYFSFNFMSLDDRLFAEDYAAIEIEYMVPTTNSTLSQYGFELFLSCDADLEAVGGKSVKGNYVIDGEYHTVKVQLDKATCWTGIINKIRYDFLNQVTPGDCVYLKSVRLIPSE